MITGAIDVTIGEGIHAEIYPIKDAWMHSVRKRPQEFLDNLVRSDSLPSYVGIVSLIRATPVPLLRARNPLNF
jgi:hypothetical protein